MTLYRIQTLEDRMINLLSGDPVRPEIAWDQRVRPGSSEVFVILDDQGSAGAVCCVAYLDCVPSSVEELLRGIVDSEHRSIAVFYTIWSLVGGFGRRLIQEAQTWMVSNLPGVEYYVTLSPPTEAARRFHLHNGARELRVNADSVNYEYGSRSLRGRIESEVVAESELVLPQLVGDLEP